MKYLLITLLLSLSCNNPLGTDTVVNEDLIEQNASILQIQNIQNITMEANSSRTLDVTISDSLSTPSCSDISVTSSQTNLIESSDITITGTSQLCSIQFSPKSNQQGLATISITLSSSGKNHVASMQLNVTFAPSVISNITSWYDPTDSETQFTDSGCTNPAISGDSIGCMKDKSNNANNATATGTDKPIIQNGVIQLRGDANANTNGTCFTINPTSARTIIMVVENAVNGTGGIHATLGGPNGQYLFLSTSMGYGVSFDGSGSDTGRYSIDDGSFSNIAENSGAQNINSNLQLIIMEYQSNQTGWIRLGCFDNGGNVYRYRANHDLHEFLTFNRVLTNSELNNIKDYINSKHSIY